jgi:hypothetical protein
MTCVMLQVHFSSLKTVFQHSNRVPANLFSLSHGVRLSILGTAATVRLLYQPQTIDDIVCGAIGGMRAGRGNRSTRRKSATVPLCPPQIPHDLTLARTRTAAVGSQRLTA